MTTSLYSALLVLQELLLGRIFVSCHLSTFPNVNVVLVFVLLPQGNVSFSLNRM